MKRIIRIYSKSGTEIEIVATIQSRGTHLTREEVEMVRDSLADRLMGTLIDLPFSEHHLSRVKVSP